MPHWSDKYLGEPYVKQTGDCAAFVQRVTRAEFGFDPPIPLSHADTLREQAKQIHSTKEDLAVKIDQPFEGCPVILESRGRTSHVGMMCFMVGEWWVLHADQTIGFVVRERLRDITKLRYKVEGFYKWK